MKKIKVIELFGGIGAPRKALENLGYDVISEVVEFDANACKSYSAIHSDIIKPINVTNYEPKLENVDILVGGFPCQPFSKAGKGQGVEDSRGLLAYDMLRVIKYSRPKFVVGENVLQILSDKHKDLIDMYVEEMDKMDYNTKVITINSFGFYTAQTRSRVFMISSTNGLPNLDNIVSPRKGTDSSKYLDAEAQHEYLNTAYADRWGEFINTNSRTAKLGYYGKDYYDKRVYKVGKELPTITASNMYMIDDGVGHRHLTSKEMFRLMGFTDDDHKRCINAGVPDVQIKKQAGNSIVVPVLEEIFKILLKNNHKK